MDLDSSKNSDITLSIVVATKGRTTELDDLFNSITGFDLSLLEIIIVDQNVSNGLVGIIEKYKDKFIIKHIKCEARGASYARNIGIRKSTGAYLCFPDDDCEFFPDTITTALSKIKGCDVLFGKCVDRSGANSVINFAEGESDITLENYQNRFVEATMFAKREIMLSFPYDEQLGVGTFHGAEEAFDLVLRLLKAGKKLFYSSLLIFYHPSKILDHSSQAELRRVFSYRCGFAKLCFKHKLYAKYFKRLILVFIAIPIFCIINRKRARFYSAEALGLLTGIIIK